MRQRCGILHDCFVDGCACCSAQDLPEVEDETVEPDGASDSMHDTEDDDSDGGGKGGKRQDEDDEEEDEAGEEEGANEGEEAEDARDGDEAEPQAPGEEPKQKRQRTTVGGRRELSHRHRAGAPATGGGDRARVGRTRR